MLAKIEKYVVLVPHIGSTTRETRLKMAKMAAENIIIGLRGENPPNLVNKEIISRRDSLLEVYFSSDTLKPKK